MRHTLLFIFLLATVLSCYAQAKSLERTLDEFIGTYSASNNFYGTVYLAKEGKVLYEKSFGKASIETNTNNENKTVYHLASVSKPITAAAILLLEQHGKLSTTDLLSKYISDFKDGNKITVHHLLTHTSGILNINNLHDYDQWSLVPQSLDSIIKIFKYSPLQFEPGAKYAYSNSNYNVLAYIIEKISGQPYGEFLRQNIFDVLDMQNTRHHGNAQSVILDAATGYAPLGLSELERAPFLNWSIKTGNGSLYSTVEDLAKFERALYAEVPLSKSSREKMFTPNLSDVGYGWFIRPFLGHDRQYMTGRSPGFSTYFSRFPKDGVCIIVLSNLYIPSTTEIGTGVASILFGEPVAARQFKDDPLSANVARPFVGKYQMGDDFFRPGFKLEITYKEGRLSCSFGDLIHDTQDEFIQRNFWSVIQFERDSGGKVTGLRFDNLKGVKIE